MDETYQQNGQPRPDQNSSSTKGLQLELSTRLVSGDLEALVQNAATDMLDIIVELNTDTAEPLPEIHAPLIERLEEFAEKLKDSKTGEPNLVLHSAKSKQTDRFIFATVSILFLRYAILVHSKMSGDKTPDPPKTDPLEPDLKDKAGVDELLTQKEIAKLVQELVRRCHRIWHDQEALKLDSDVNESNVTISADAALSVYSGNLGKGIVWALIDSGIDPHHEHFELHQNLDLSSERLLHIDLLGSDLTGYTLEELRELPEFDEAGHGTHVAATIAGELQSTGAAKGVLSRAVRQSNSMQEVEIQTTIHGPVRGVAPLCKLMALRVLDQSGKGRLSNVLVALAYIRRQNEGRARMKIHGVNLSVGFDYDASWYAAGASPLCREVDRLVASGVTVVTAAGNRGCATVLTTDKAGVKAAALSTITDPGNAHLAITVGSTHRRQPATFGVSFFSSKGPTADGRMKPDLVAPGERIASARAQPRDSHKSKQPRYEVRSGTSMAAPHVSGAVACLMSVRPEFIGNPAKVKERLCQTATDLGRERTFQGHGCVDVMALLSRR